MSKSILKSKSFWLNVLGAIATYGGFIPLDPQTATYVLAAANIGIRILTKGPVHVIQDAANEP